MGVRTVVAGLACLLDCFARFALEGRGTPAPVLQTEVLVASGLYQFVRNPMYVCVLTIVSGQVLLFGQSLLFAYAGLLLLHSGVKQVYYCTRSTVTGGRRMATRQTITLREPNDVWLRRQVDRGEFANKSEVVNDLIRQARRHEEIRAGLIQAERGIEKYGYSEKTPEERLEDFKEKARRNGQL